MQRYGPQTHPRLPRIPMDVWRLVWYVGHLRALDTRCVDATDVSDRTCIPHRSFGDVSAMLIGEDSSDDDGTVVFAFAMVDW
mmetsp:Transcript_4908/g.5980  ORF Transcript_4908/g.5980 Transcript_4908/m.5980 type:complete len:82 (+) Transcript_4908:793-1038(+)